MLLISRVNWAKLTSDDKQQIDSRLRAIISLSREELSKLFVYGHTKVVISAKVNLSQYIIEIKFNLPVQMTNWFAKLKIDVVLSRVKLQRKQVES